MSITKIYKIIDPRSAESSIADNRDYYSNGGAYGNYTWYHRVVNGSGDRIVRYKEYDVMDADVDIARALDIIAEEMTGNNPKTELPFVLKLEVDGGVTIQSKVVATLNAALKTWCTIHSWKNRIYDISRQTIKYGDCFFLRPKKKHGKYIYVHAKNVAGAIVSIDDISDIKGWHIRRDFNHLNQNNPAGSLYYSGNSNFGDVGIEEFDAKDVIRFTLNDDMSYQAPFGQSILSDVFKSFKQKELLEDSILIYRVQRAPERRVFYIDVAHVHPAKVSQHLEQIKTEIRQRKIPNINGGQSSIDSMYSPQSMNEDFFFAQYKDGAGSKVETLQGGQNLGELQDLEYFYKKIWRGLRVPQSYIDPNTEGGGYSDGKVGIAYMQEINFALHIERLQSKLESTFDFEFKRFLRECNILVDESLFRLTLPSPSNYDVSRKQAMDSELLQTYASADSVSTLSKRFAMKKYLQLTDEELIINERMLREEKGLDPNGDKRDLPTLYSPETAEAGGFEGGLGTFSGSSSGGASSFNGEDLDDPELNLDTDTIPLDKNTDKLTDIDNTDNKSNEPTKIDVNNEKNNNLKINNK